MKLKKLKVLGICSGSGLALLTPFLSEPFKVLGAIEPRAVFHTPKEETWKKNFGKRPFIKSYEVNQLDFPRPNIIVSSPDCGASSIMRLSKSKKLGNPRESKTLNMVISSINFYLPELFLIENLPKLLEFIKPAEFESLFPTYNLVFHCHSVMEFGNSQKSRKRAVIIGIKRSSKFKKESFEKIFQVNKPKITRRLLFDAQKECNFIPPMDKKLAMYDYRKLPKKENLTVKEIYHLWNNDFKDEYKWPIKTKRMSCLPGVYRLKEEDYPKTLRPSDRQFRPDGLPLGISDFQNIMGIPFKYRPYFPEKYQVISPNAEDKDYTYWLNKARYAITKGSVSEIPIWFKLCILKSATV